MLFVLLYFFTSGISLHFRSLQGLRELDVDVIELVEDIHHSVDEEEKISSSSFRKRLLGTLIHSPVRRNLKYNFIFTE